ncbi:MAG: hypothetical protein VB012_04980 [Erysipelotrichaceae bacterium]|nr:hypothetical protein [Erysipelotrichaceae bacterium]
MKTKQKTACPDEERLDQLGHKIQSLITCGNYIESEQLIREALMKYPHAAEPQNLFGILLENTGDHPAAMKHFRAAWALDPTFLPARYNMNQYADLTLKKHRDAYFAEDCDNHDDKTLYKLEYDENGIGHVISRVKNAVFTSRR